jgi:heat shock protein HslJ
MIFYPAPDGRLQVPLRGTEVTATFLQGQLAGSAGCNRYTGTYQVNGDALTLSQPASTRMFCADPPGVMDQEAAYLASFGRVARYALAANQLILFDASGAVVLSFIPQTPVPLEGTDWVVESYNNGAGAVVTPLTGTELTARFADGHLSGSGGCNTYTAAYTVGGAVITVVPITGGGTITIGPAASTLRACVDPPGVMEQETAYLTALPKAEAFRIESDRLILEQQDGTRVASFRARM